MDTAKSRTSSVPHSQKTRRKNPPSAPGSKPKSGGIQAVSSKMAKTALLLRSAELRKHVPSTRPLSRGTLASMLDRYGMVYVKPDTGSMGIGVMRVEKNGGSCRYQSGKKIFAFKSITAMFPSIRRQAGTRRYLVQKGIRVLKHGGRPFDFRIMIQRNPAGRWACTGTAARVASPGKIVSNGSQGGTIYAPKTLLDPVAGKAGTIRLLKRMDRLALLTAAKFGRAYPAMNELGLDIAIDRKLKPWILEVNTRPDPCPFTKLDDQTAIRRIVRCAKAYGRRYSLVCGKAKKAP
ncbi:YheC/YheD family protein [Paenibacillus sp. D9]|uniref:YheC/YheD family protein n=1 Tax=Paenibacillus sp. D9 TaxID=665792 RepID=UPI0009FCEBCD|nr:YheC/YheD family protein [Paenibacillus sp. D9]